MTDKLNIDIANIDKNSMLFKKFMNQKQNIKENKSLEHPQIKNQSKELHENEKAAVKGYEEQ